MNHRLVAGTMGVVAAALSATATRAVKHRRQAAEGYSLPSAPAVTEPAFEHLLEALTGACVTGGNSVVVLRNGCRIFPAMLDAIRSAAADHRLRDLRLLDWVDRRGVRRRVGGGVRVQASR